MADFPLVSIILPVYNGAEHIHKSINSILSQDYKNIELIIVNDCSTDNTLNIINTYAEKDSRISIVSNLENLKLPRTLNVGFANAKGVYLTWTSDDNMYKPNAISTMVAALTTNKGTDMVYSNYTNIDSQDNEISIGNLPNNPNSIISGNCCGACFLYSKEIANRVGEYDPNLFLAEDYDYWIRIHSVGKIIHINDNLYYYRRHSNSLTETKKEKINNQTYKALEKNFFHLYSIAKLNHTENDFFDHLIRRAGKEMEDAVKSKIRVLKPSYFTFYKFRFLKSKLLSHFHHNKH